MKILKFVISLFFTTGLVYLLNIPLTTGGKTGTTLPPLGHFLSPFTGYWQNADAETRQLFKSFELPDMKDKVTVHFDERMVPHIFAQNVEDVLFAQGYIEAGMRLGKWIY